jgi:predicted  nucleic acid-binding Zn-ribbon protein
MPVRVCETCGKSFSQGRGRPARWCPEHRNGGGKYGGEHAKLRAATVGQAWGTACTRCGRVLEWGQAIQLDHVDGGGPSDYRGYSHASCNQAAGARKVNRMRAAVNGYRPTARPAAPDASRALVPEGPNPEIEHGPDCKCQIWTSRCW